MTPFHVAVIVGSVCVLIVVAVLVWFFVHPYQYDSAVQPAPLCDGFVLLPHVEEVPDSRGMNSDGTPSAPTTRGRGVCLGKLHEYPMFPL